MNLGDTARKRLHVLPIVAALLALFAASQASWAAAPPAAEASPLAPVTEADARTQNLKIPLVTKGFVAARPFVYAGGGDAKAGVNRVIRADGREERLTATASTRMDVGDRFVIETPGGGGYGRR